MKTKILSIIDKFIEQSKKGIMINPLQELRQEIEAMEEPFIPEIDNFYEFSEGGEVWIKGRLMRYSYRSKEGGVLSATHIRPLPPHP